MITIKINSKDTEVKTFDDLSVREYTECVKAMRDDGLDLVKYLSIVLRIPYRAAWDADIHNSEILALVIGAPQDYTKISPLDEFLYDDKLYKQNELSILTLGQRLMIEEQGKNLKDEQLICYILAVAIVKEPDAFKIKEVYEELLDRNYLEVLPSAFFLHMSFSNGSNYAIRNFKRLKRSPKTIFSNIKQAYIDWMFTRTILRSRLSAKL